MQTLFAIAGVDAIGKHTFFKHCPIQDRFITTTPDQAVLIGNDEDASKLINRYQKELVTDWPVNYIRYNVKSNLTNLEFWDETDTLQGKVSIH